jgi:hypothetical protein
MFFAANNEVQRRLIPRNLAGEASPAADDVREGYPTVCQVPSAWRQAVPRAVCG